MREDAVELFPNSTNKLCVSDRERVMLKMGKQISKYEYQIYGSDKLMKPIIFCYPDEKLKQNAIALNVIIAEMLVSVKPERRSFRLPGIIDTIIAKLPEKSMIKEFDVLFNPDYHIDVLQILISACKKKEFTILWPGTYSEGKLIYAENGYADFKIFDLEKYDVTCIV